MNIRIILIIFVSYLKSISSEVHEIEHDQISSMSLAIVGIAKSQIFGNDPTATIIRPTSQSEFSISDTIHEISVNLKDSMALKILDMETVNKTRDRRMLNIILINNYEDFEAISEFYNQKLLNFRGFFDRLFRVTL